MALLYLVFALLFWVGVVVSTVKRDEDALSVPLIRPTEKGFERLSGRPSLPLLDGSWYQSPVVVHYKFGLTFPNVCQGLLSSELVVVGV